MNSSEAFLFCRYLIEPQENEIVDFDENRIVSACKIIIRLMNQIGDFSLFKTSDQDSLRGKLAMVFRNNQSKDK